MALDYRGRMVDFARSGADGGIGRDELFEAAYDTWLQKKQPGLEAGEDARFITWVARMVGVPEAVVPNLVTDTLRTDLEHAGIESFASGAVVPTPGDLVIHDENKIGLLVAADPNSGKVTITEASVNGAGHPIVWLKTIYANSAFVDRYYSPDYALRRIKRGVNQTRLSALVKRSWTRRFQEWLNGTYADVELVTDGTLGARTKAAFIDAWKVQLNRDARLNLVTDGIFDADARLAATKRCLKLRSTGNMVKLLQGLLYTHGYDPKTFDGKFSASTRDAISAFQKNRHLLVTGTVDSGTWESLLTRW